MDKGVPYDESNICYDVIANMQLGVLVFGLANTEDESSLILLSSNEAAEKLTGIRFRDNIGNPAGHFNSFLGQFDLSHKLAGVISENKPREMENLFFINQIEGTGRFFNIKIFPLQNYRVSLIIEDVSNRMQTESILKMTRFGLEHASDAIFWTDQSGRLFFANITACDKLGYTEEEILNKSMPDIDTSLDQKQWKELVKVLDKKGTLTFETAYKAKNKKAFDVEVALNRFVFNGKKVYFAFVRDIGNRKKNEDLERRIELAKHSVALKQQFLANMSHEIRTPLTSIMGMVSLLNKTSLNDDQKQYLENLKISSDNLLNIINDILDLSKIEAGKMELKSEPVDLEKFASEFREFFAMVISQKELDFQIEVDPFLPGKILVDGLRLRQIVNNLLSNAFKFTHEGFVKLKFNLDKQAGTNLLVRVEVHDSGIGIDKINQKKIFEKFTQLDTSNIRPFEGSGLGLAICRELAHLMGGEIGVESHSGKGSIFYFTFTADADPAEKTGASKKPETHFQQIGLNVLLVDDKRLNQKVIRLMLENAGCKVVCANNGLEALNAYKPGKFDLIIMDIQMPVMDGIAATKELRKRHKDLPPVIGLSANVLKGDEGFYLKEGLDDYIPKPFNSEKLISIINKWK